MEFQGASKRRMSIRRRTGAQANRKYLVEPEETVLGDNHQQIDRGKVLDGAFFEDFVILDDNQARKVENAYKGAMKDDEKLYQPPDQSIFVPPDKLKALELHKELIYTIKYQLGKRKQGGDSLTDGEIYAHAKQVFNITETEHKAIHDDVSALKAPECYLNVQVVAAEGLDAKDANGLSDPYCMLSLINNGEGDIVKQHKRKKKVLRSFVDEDSVKLTKIKMRTLSPEWKQHFKFVVSNVQKQVLRLDLWDKDDGTVMLDSNNTITAIKGFRGAGRFLKEMYQSATTSKGSLDDFMGLVEVPLMNISENGFDTWFPLESQSEKKKVGGRIHLKLSFSAKVSSKHASLVHVASHQDSDYLSSNISVHSPNIIYKEFLTYFAHYDCQRANELEPAVRWDGVLVEHSRAVLLQYTIQHEINRLEQAAMKWIVYSKLSERAHVSLGHLCNLLDEYRESILVCEELEEKELADFVESLNIYCNYCQQLLLKYRYLFSVLISSKCIQLGKLLMSLLLIHDLPVYKKNFPAADLRNEIKDIIQKSTTEWFYVMEAYSQSIGQSALESMEHLVHLTNTVNADLNKGMTAYKPIFNLIHIDYISLVFNCVELLLCDIIVNTTNDLESRLSWRKTSQKVGTTMFELYIAVRNLYAFKKDVPNEKRNKGGLDNFSEWFKKGVIKWLDIAAQKAAVRIKKAVEIDEVRVIDSMVKHSTSAVDVTCCLGQICIFWKQLEWPDPSGAFMFLTQITDTVGKCAMDYGNIILHQLKAKGFYDDEGQFDVTDQLCIMMNNMAHVLQFLDYVPQTLNYKGTVASMAQLHGEDCVPQIDATLRNILICAQDDMRNKLYLIIDHVGSRMKDSFHGYLLKVINQQNPDVAQVADPLLEYIDNNLVTLNSALLTTVFDIVLIRFWEVLVEALSEFEEKYQKKLQKQHYSKMSNLLELTVDFFHADGKGISYEDLQVQCYKDLSSRLSLNKLTTHDLIEKHYMDMCELQKTVDSSLGQITFKVFFCNRTKSLNIYVMNCKKLLPMDTTGSSDPYVMLRLIPVHLFPDHPTYRTHVQSSTLYPLFDEMFQFEIPPPDCLKDGATLLFTVFDKDRLSDDDIAGEVYYDLQNVPGLNSDTVKGAFATAPQVDMNFMVGQLKGDSITALKNRLPGDSVAVNFLHKRKQRILKMSSNIQKAQDLLSQRK